MGSNFMDEMDCGNFFDQIDDLIEFPSENEYGDRSLVSFGDYDNFPSMWNDVLPDSDPLLSSSHDNPKMDMSAELYVPYEDSVQLEWLSTFIEDSFSGEGMTIGKNNLSANPDHSQNQFRSSSPISVLESSSSSSSSNGKTVPFNPTHRGPQRARSKRPRPATFNPRAAIQLISPTPPSKLLSDNFADAESPPKKKIPKFNCPEKKRKLKVAFPENPNETNQEVRKCMHCEITKTPQWRSGPMGPKSLCNACGVRCKSGRLFPEYRPAASPTFVPSLHSNSHKKVVEMRNQAGRGPMATDAKPEFIPTALV